ncbi:MAG: ribonuclease E/G, partial [Hydrogenophaga sp.]|nr:ribonuclease E/G [Hydrogenophaga sp.]
TEGGDNQRRERRGRNDNRRRGAGAEGVEASTSTDNQTALGVSQDAGVPTDSGVTAEVQGTEGSENREGDNGTRAPRERRSRDRYGRDRRERAPRDGEGAHAAADSAALTPREPQGETTEEAPVRSSYFSMPVDAAAEPVAKTAAPADPARDAPRRTPPSVPTTTDAAPATAPPAAPVQATAAPAQAPATSALPAVAPFDLPVEDLHAVARSSGLEWVNSDPVKVAQVQAAIAAEPTPVHVPREPRPPVIIDEGPLVLVETRKDLRDMRLPFENA